MKLPLSIAFAENPRTRPVLDGRVTAEGIDLNPSVVGPSELFWRQLRYADFDVAEMSFSSLIIAMSKGDDRFLALPIFTTRRFFHAHILVRREFRHREARRFEGQARRRDRIPADRRAVDARRAGARMGRAVAGHGILHGAHARTQPRRRHGLQAARRRHGASDSVREKRRLDDAVGRIARLHPLSRPRLDREPLQREPCWPIPTSARCFPTCARRAFAT